MADFSQRTTKVTRHEWRLTLPSNWVELDKLLYSVKAYVEAEGLKFNDSLTVEADDEEIRVVREVWTDV